MKYIGVFAVFLAVLLFCRAYRKHLLSELDSLRGIIGFIGELKRHTVCYLEPPSRWVGKYKCDFPDGGFLSLIEERGIGEAFEAARGKMSLPEAAEPLLSELFSGFGRGYLDEEKKKIEYAEDRLREILTLEEKRVGERTKIILAVSFSLAFGIMLFVL